MLNHNVVLCIAGKNDIAVRALKFALAAYHKVAILACPNPEDNGQDGWQPSFRKLASKLGVPIVEIKDIEGISNLVFVSLEYSRIVKVKKFLSHRLFNIHFSLLPAYRGAYTSIWPILNGEKFTGVTLHKIDDGIDTGEIVSQRKIEIKPYMTSRDLYFTYMAVGFEIFQDYLDILIKDPNPESTPQPIEGASFYSRESIDFSDLEITFNGTADQIVRKLRALSFPEYQLPKYKGRDVLGWHIQLERSTMKPGTIVESSENRTVVTTRDYNLCLLTER